MKSPYLSTAEFAARHGVESQTARLWASNGRIPGCIQVGERWLIPSDAERPVKLPTGRRPAKVPG